MSSSTVRFRPYLCALYSLDPDRNPEAVEIMVSVFVEEMLHMALVVNVLNAVGGRLRLDTPETLAPYPRCLPHGDRSFVIPLVPFGLEAIGVFLRIEQQAPPDSWPESDYETIGPFYQAIERGLQRSEWGARRVESVLRRPSAPGEERVLTAEAGASSWSRTLETALAALEEIVEQGEGANHGQVWDGDRDVFHPEREQVGHYYRFQELKLGRRYRRGDTPQSGPTGDPLGIPLGGRPTDATKSARQ